MLVLLNREAFTETCKSLGIDGLGAVATHLGLSTSTVRRIIPNGGPIRSGHVLSALADTFGAEVFTNGMMVYK